MDLQLSEIDLVGWAYLFFNVFKFLSCKSFACLVRVTPRYFISFEVIVKGVVSLISFSFQLPFKYRQATDSFFFHSFIYFLVNFVCGYFAGNAYLYV